MSEPLVVVERVSRRYERGRVLALREVSLTVERSEFVALTGPSGCGKSTLLHLLAALDRPTTGRILIDGTDLRARHDHNRYRRSEIGVVFQLHNLIPRLTASENVEIAMFGTHRSHRERRERARALFEELGLAALADRTPPKLSGGERQRVAIARALANRPRLLLADEPTGSLDAAAAASVVAMFERLRTDHGTTVVMVTHDQSLAALADRQVPLIAPAADAG
jgi:putative ABC transport system ATP-binding protein